MKIEVWCDNGNNIHSCRKEIIDLIEDWGFSQDDCDALTERDIQEYAHEWANEFLDIGAVIVEE